MTITEKQTLWQEHITAWQSSGLSQTAYCQQHDLKLNTFTYWRNKLNQPRRKLMPVSLGALGQPVELALPGGIQLQVPVAALDQVLPLLWRLLREQV